MYNAPFHRGSFTPKTYAKAQAIAACPDGKEKSARVFPSSIAPISILGRGLATNGLIIFSTKTHVNAPDDNNGIKKRWSFFSSRRNKNTPMINHTMPAVPTAESPKPNALNSPLCGR